MQVRNAPYGELGAGCAPVFDGCLDMVLADVTDTLVAPTTTGIPIPFGCFASPEILRIADYDG